MINKIKEFVSRPLIIFALLFALITPTIIPLLSPGFFPTQDYIYVARIYQMHKALMDGQFPVRWVPDFRYGEPLYNFYSPAAYYVGAIIKIFGFSYLDTTKILLGLGFFLSGIAMYFLGRALFGKFGGFMSAIFYVWAPYRSVDVYVRGALSESWALIFFPLIFLFSYKQAINPNRKNFVFLSLSLAGLFYTHNIMTLLFTPFFILWVTFLILKDKKFFLIKNFSISFLLGIGLAASFLLPAFFEKDLTQSKYLLDGYFNFRGHFVAWPQFFSPFWGYGASLWGSKDDMSFQLGLIHWVGIFIALPIALFFRKNKQMLMLVLFFAFLFTISLFMQHNKSAPIWEAFSVLSYTQFPWRFLGISIFFASLIAGSLGFYLKGKIAILGAGLVIAAVLYNYQYFHPDSYYLDSVDAHYMSEKVLSQDDKLPKDYLPIWVKEISKEKSILPMVKSGEVTFSDLKKRSDYLEFKSSGNTTSEIEAPLTYFPGWKAWIDGKEVIIKEPGGMGLVKIDLPEGDHFVQMKFTNNAIRNVGNFATIISLVLILGILKFKQFRL